MMGAMHGGLALNELGQESSAPFVNFPDKSEL